MAKLLTEFIIDFLSDEAFRFAVLRKEVSTMTQYGLTTAQQNVLLRLDSTEIANAIKDELIANGGDVDTLREIISGTITCGGAGAGAGTTGNGPQALAAAAASAYTQGFIHIRCVDATHDAANNVYHLTIRGHGFDYLPEIEFRQNGTAIVTNANEEADAGTDLLQHVKVSAPLTSGTWEVRGRNSSLEDFAAVTKDIGQITIP